jgi:hypothetical protein
MQRLDRGRSVQPAKSGYLKQRGRDLRIAVRIFLAIWLNILRPLQRTTFDLRAQLPSGRDYPATNGDTLGLTLHAQPLEHVLPRIVGGVHDPIPNLPRRHIPQTHASGAV